LANRQLPSGEFATRRWEKPKVETASYVKSVFITSFVLHSLRYVENLTQVKEISQRAIGFLLNEMERDGLWRFFGRDSFIHFDVDCTCCILASLKEWRIEIDYHALASLLLKYRDDKGLFYTWILDICPPFEKGDNNIDWVVNANVLFFYSLLDQPLPEVEQYLIRIVETGAFQQRSPYYGSLYYDSPFAFIYCLTRAYADGCNSRLSPVVAKVRGYLLHVNAENISCGDHLENALAAVGLLNCGCGITESTQVVRYLLSIQEEDGGWPMGIFHTGGPYTEYRIAYGSRELTTSIALEAIFKYLKEDK
ncbi:hypothetical protein KA005_09955, partial [bacterium]|nr:hypothetical protein [bacterium]